jgi:hypothetical protein
MNDVFSTDGFKRVAAKDLPDQGLLKRSSGQKSFYEIRKIWQVERTGVVYIEYLSNNGSVYTMKEDRFAWLWWKNQG